MVFLNLIFSSSLNIFQEPHCLHSFKSDTACRRHYALVHEKWGSDIPVQHKCSVCKEEFKSQHYLCCHKAEQGHFTRKRNIVEDEIVINESFLSGPSKKSLTETGQPKRGVEIVTDDVVNAGPSEKSSTEAGIPKRGVGRPRGSKKKAK